MEKIKQNQDSSKDVFLLGGSDLEMYQIEKRLRRAGAEFVNRGLQWGATIDAYNDEINAILSDGNVPVAIELGGADSRPDVVDIDHHNEKSGREASIVQVMDRLGRSVGLVDAMIAANDAGYIPGMEAKMDEYRPVLEERYGEEKFLRLKKKLIDLIRRKDREMQGVTSEAERDAEEAILNAERFSNGLVVTRMRSSKPSPVTDRLFTSWPDGKQNLVVVCNSDEQEKHVYYFGRGDVCKSIRERFSGWGGGTGYGKKDEMGFGGAVAEDPQVVIDAIVSELDANLDTKE